MRPASGRFNTKDSWQGDYNRPLSLNRWMYANNNPLNYTDPTGHFQQVANSSTCLVDHCATPEELGKLFNKGQEDKKWREENGCAFVSPLGQCAGPGGDYIQNERNDEDARTATRYVRNTALAVGVVYFGPAAFSAVYDAIAYQCLINWWCASLTGMAMGSNPSSGTTVLGYTEDLAYYEDVEVNMLQNVPNWSWEGANVPFIRQAMSRGDNIVLISDFTEFPLRTFPQEVLYLLEQNAKNVIDLFSSLR